LGREDIFKLTVGNESLHQDCNDKSVRIVNFATSKYVVAKAKMFPHRNLHSYIVVGRLKARLIIYLWIGDGIRMYSMCNLSW